MKRIKYLTVAVMISAVILLISGFISPEGTGEDIKVAIVHAGSSNTWLEAYQHFSQPFLANLKVDEINLDKENIDLRSYDMVYPDTSVLKSSKAPELKKNIINYISGGGAVFLENRFYNWLPKEILGARGFKKITSLPEKLTFPEVRSDLNNLQSLIRDFNENYKGFKNYKELKNKAYGYGILPSSAVPVVKTGDTALYTLNRYGKGYVFFTNPLLPNVWFTSSFDMLPKTNDQGSFNNTVAAGNQMIRNEFAAFLSKQKYGYALKKVYGPYGRPATAWQNHFEVLSAIHEGSMEKWIDIARKYDEIPSYSLARGTYEWFVRYESIGYQLNTGDNGELSFSTEQQDSFYAPGKHVVSEGKWLTQAKCPKDQSFFSEMELPHRAYPFIKDLDNDGILDITSGSSDGYFYYYHGLEKGTDWVLSKAERLKDTAGKEIKADAFSSPVLYDLDGDGDLDLVTGSEKGNIYWFQNAGNFKFIYRGPLISSGSKDSLTAPDIGDIDGDGISDLIVGNKAGGICAYKGKMKGSTLTFGQGKYLTDSRGKQIKVDGNAAPRIYDMNNDGKNDLAVGTWMGYIKKLINEGNSFSDGGYIEGNYPNFLGNKNYKYGNNAVPAFADVNSDGRVDLIVGRLEYGMAVAIDSKWFPYVKELAAALKYATMNHVNVEPHYFTHKFKASAEEKKELTLQKAAFEKYGLKWEGEGTNQHTWYVSNPNPVQTLYNEYESGLKWNSGFRPAGLGIEPSYGTEYTWIVPYYLCRDGKTTDMLLFNAARFGASGVSQYTGKWNTLASIYQHSEYDAVRNPAKLEKNAALLDKFRDSYDYNFMSEDQMAKSLRTVLDTKVAVKPKPLSRLVYSIENSLRTFKQFEISLTPVNNGEEARANDPYAQVAGVKVEPGEKYTSAVLDTDADIYMRSGKDLYIGLNKSVRVFTAMSPEERPYIERVNLPVKVEKTDKGMNINFLDGGLQQIKFHSASGIRVIGVSEWKIEKSDKDSYVLTRFGDPDVLKVSFAK